MDQLPALSEEFHLGPRLAVLMDVRTSKVAGDRIVGVLAKSISTTDWYMNHLLFGGHYCERSAGLIGEIDPLYLHCSEDLRKGNPEAERLLLEKRPRHQF